MSENRSFKVVQITWLSLQNASHEYTQRGMSPLHVPTTFPVMCANLKISMAVLLILTIIRPTKLLWKVHIGNNTKQLRHSFGKQRNNETNNWREFKELNTIKRWFITSTSFQSMEANGVQSCMPGWEDVLLLDAKTCIIKERKLVDHISHDFIRTNHTLQHNKQYHMKVRNSFQLNGHTLGFNLQT